MCFGPVCCITPDVTGPARSITLAVTGLSAHSIILAFTVLAPVITPAAFTMYINYVSLWRIAVMDWFRVWLRFIFPLIDVRTICECTEKV